MFSSIDRTARYAYGNQPRIAVWNMAQLATALIQLYDDKDQAIKEATAIVHAMPDQLQNAWLRRFGAKLGLHATPEDQKLIEDLLAMMQAQGADFTNTFAALSTDQARDQFSDRDAFDTWAANWQARTPDMELMARSNPQLIPRNHRIEAMIEAAVTGDMAPFKRLTTALAQPFDATDSELKHPPTDQEIVPATFCGT